MELFQEKVLNSQQACFSLPVEESVKIEHQQQKPAEEIIDHSFLNHRKDLESSLSSILCPNEEDSRLEKARAVLGEAARAIPDDELAIHLTEFQYLLDGWLDNYEKSLFNGSTLQEIIREG